MSNEHDRDSDKAWARQMIGAWMHKYYVPAEALDELADKFAEAFQTAREQSAESLGDIQVKAAMLRKGESGYEVFLGDKRLSYLVRTQDIGVLLALGDKHLGHGEGGRFAKFAGRALGIQDDWTE